MAIVALPFIYATAFSDVMLYDDQGALMITFHDLMAGKRLYNDEFALYGPFYYFTIGSLFSILDLPLTHDVVRAVSAVFWLACTGIVSALVFRLTRSLIAAAFGFLAALFILRNFSHSPTHPQEISLLLLVCVPHLLLDLERSRTSLSLAFMGVIIAGLMLTKINLGTFVALATALTVLRASERAVWTGPAYALLAAASLSLPLVIM